MQNSNQIVNSASGIPVPKVYISPVDQRELTINSCTDIHPKRCCDCVFDTSDLDDCYKKYGKKCTAIAKSKCEKCSGECENLCNEIYGNSTTTVSPRTSNNDTPTSVEDTFGSACGQWLIDNNFFQNLGNRTLGSLGTVGWYEIVNVLKLLCGGENNHSTGLCCKSGGISSQSASHPCKNFCKKCNCESTDRRPPGGPIDPSNGLGGGGGGSGGGGEGSGCNPPDPELCRQCMVGYGNPSSKPLDVLYRHSGCHFIWYPPEYAFGGDPRVTQCQGFNSRSESGNGTFISSCHPTFTPFSTTVGAANASSFFSGCQTYSRDGWPDRPCSCRKFAHLKGGISDTVYKTTNMSLKVGQAGYIPFMNPFISPMRLSEIGCCWCASPDGPKAEDFANKRSSTEYPFASQKYLQASGQYCVDPNINQYTPFSNIGYKTSCFEYGISPYLQRVALEGFNNNHPYKCGFDIWTFGGKNTQTKDYGPIYSAWRLYKKPEIEGFPEYDISYRETLSSKNKLKEQLVGFVTLEHHFEAWATRSDDGAKHPNLPPNLNHGNVIVDPFERPYGAAFVDSLNGGQKCLFYPEESLRHSLMRTTPRRFMYAGSQIPIFHFDLYNFKNYSIENEYYINGDFFSPEKFLKGYYNYFYTLIESDGRGTVNNITPPDISSSNLLDDYNYVTTSLEAMVVAGIIRIKDHAIDIAEETKQVIGAAGTDSEGNLILDPYTSAIVGGTLGYQNLKTFLGVTGPDGITPLLIKSKLGALPGGAVTTGQANDGYNLFPFPRRATLPVYMEGGRVVNWGCKNTNCCVGSPNITPPIFNSDQNNDPQTQWLASAITKVFTGLNTNWYVTYQGKISGSGYIAGNMDKIPSDISITTDNESDNADLNLGQVIKLGGKGQNFEIALIDYPLYYDQSYCPTEPICDFINGGDVCLATRGQAQEKDPNSIFSEYRLKSWGDNHCDYATFGVDDISPRNKRMTWADVANGCKHTLALTSTGLVYVVGNNDFEQKKYCYEPNPNEAFSNANYITANKAVPGFISDGEYFISTSYAYSNSPTGVYNEKIYVNLNNYCNGSTPKDARCAIIENSLPIFTKVACGYYHNIAIQSDNQIKIWGKYLFVDSYGNPINTNNSVHDVFVPDEVKQLADKWTVLYEDEQYPYVATSVSLQSKHGDSSAFIFADGGPDYTIVGTKDTIYVWGRKEMLPNYDKNTDTENSFGFYTKSFNGEIIKISAGINGFAVIYSERLNSNTSIYGKKYKVNKTFIWTRKGEDNCGLTPTDENVKSDFGYSDISFGAGHAVAIKYGSLKSPIWDYNGFLDPVAKDGQFAHGSNNIPRYFRRQAFFRAVPGNWDFSKWIWGYWCDFKITGLNDPILALDKCSALAEPDSTTYSGLKNPHWGYSGHPEYWWMNSKFRRYQKFVPNHSVQPTSLVCQTYGTFDTASQSILSAGASTTAPGCPEQSDICWQATGLPQTRATERWAPEDPNCGGTCKHTCEGNYCVRNCCPSDDTTTLHAECTNSIGRIGFNGNKDYFIQSYKAFTRVDQCCRCVYTNISYVNYATRLNYFGYDENTGVFTVKYIDNPYRTPSIPTSGINDVGGTETQAPDTTQILPGINLENIILYPYVYCGGGGRDVNGGGLGALESSFYSSYYGIIDQGNQPCDDAQSCILQNPGTTILGPGGWIWWQNRDTIASPISNGYFSRSIWLNDTVYAPVKTPYDLLGTHTYGGISWGNYTIFDPDNENAYAKTYGDSLSTKWHKIGVDRHDIWNNLVFGPVAFDGGNPTTDDVKVINYGSGNIQVMAADILCNKLQ